MTLENPVTLADDHWSSHVRIQADLVLDGPDRFKRRIWFAAPRELEVDLSRRGDPWLIALLPFAMARGEALRISLPVDATLFAHADELQSLWTRWNPGLLRVVPLHAEATGPPKALAHRRFLSFFTGGIDSYFTALHPELPSEVCDPATFAKKHELVYVDFSPEHPASSSKVDAVRRASEAIGIPIQILASNIQHLRLARLRWGEVLHGFALGAIGQLLSPRYSHVLIPSSHSPPHDFPWGSHPDSDPLFSSASTQVLHHSGGLSRFEKTRRLSNSPGVFDSVHVCFTDEQSRNCSRCEKCLRTMAALDLLGCLQASAAFDCSDYHVDRLRRLQLNTKSALSFSSELLQAAQNLGRQDMVLALQDGFAWNAKRRRVVDAIGRLGRIPGMGPIARSLQRKARRRLWMHAAK